MACLSSSLPLQSARVEEDSEEMILFIILIF